MHAQPFLGVLLHALGGLAAGSFYLPYKKVRGWAWELYWLVGGVFSWIIAPWIAAAFTSPRLFEILRGAPAKSLLATYLLGVLWGVGGLTFGLSMRYLGLSLGYALALGFCAVFGTFRPDHAGRRPRLPGRDRRLRPGRGPARKGSSRLGSRRRRARAQLRQGPLDCRICRDHELLHGLRLRRRQAHRRPGRRAGNAGHLPELPGHDRSPGRRLHHQCGLVRHPSAAQPPQGPT
jgi:hypothetical protein